MGRLKGALRLLASSPARSADAPRSVLGRRPPPKLPEVARQGLGAGGWGGCGDVLAVILVPRHQLRFTKARGCRQGRRAR